MDTKLKRQPQRDAVDDAIWTNQSLGNREIARLLKEQGIHASHPYVGNRRRVLGIPNSETLYSRFKGEDGSIKNVSSAKSEEQIEEAVACYLRTANPLLDVKTQVATRLGVADIVVDGSVYEVKLILTRDPLFKALGQVLAYQADVGRSDKRGAIVAGNYSLLVQDLITQVTKLGVDVFLWNDEQLIFWEHFCTVSPHPAKIGRVNSPRPSKIGT